MPAAMVNVAPALAAPPQLGRSSPPAAAPLSRPTGAALRPRAKAWGHSAIAPAVATFTIGTLAAASARRGGRATRRLQGLRRRAAKAPQGSANTAVPSGAAAAAGEPPRAEAAAGTAAAGSTSAASAPEEPEAEGAGQALACPVCQRRLALLGAGGAECRSCRLAFPQEPEGNFTDLTIGAALPAAAAGAATRAARTSAPRREGGWLQRLPFVSTADAVAERLGLPQSGEVEALGRELLRDPRAWLGRQAQPAGTSTFQNPFVSFAYERGWRSQFQGSGFPGVDEEFRLAQDFLAEGYSDGPGALLDASCGSGLFSRRFAASGKYESVIALDYSAAMLRQVDDFAVKELGPDYAAKVGLKLVRADIARLPFASNELGGVHAGAAIHCWPAPENAVAEVARVLRPGGVFVLSTFRPRMGRGGAFRFWEEEELRTLTRRCGLTDFKSIKRDPAFIMVRVKKPLPE